jgi:Kazal-type serine protease inhibitor domain
MKSAGVCPSSLSNDPCVPIENEYSPKPLCASNGRTYATLREIRCLKKTKPTLKVMHQGACTVQDVDKIVGHTEVCKAAINTYKVKPICGSDNVTYSDAYAALCSAKNTPKDKTKSKDTYIQ